MLETREPMVEVKRRIEALPVEQREVLLLVCVGDLSYREAADILSLPVATVIRRLTLARQRIIQVD